MKKTQWNRRLLLQESTQILEGANIEDARRNVEWMLCELLVCNRALLYAHLNEPLSPALFDRFQEMMDRRLRREPLQYILGYTEFMGHRIPVDGNVLIPRPETEWIVSEVIQAFPEAGSWLDVGTGSGCIAISLKLALPAAHVYACDVSPGALATAARAAASLDADVAFFEADLLAGRFEGLGGTRVDVIISNPPYIPTDEALELAPEVIDYEPHIALFAGTDPLRFYRALLQAAPALLNPGGRIVLEIHADEHEGVEALLADAGFGAVTMQRDLAGRPRMVQGTWQA